MTIFCANFIIVVMFAQNESHCLIAQVMLCTTQGGAVSITQVAEHAGVAISTVSRYLRGTLNVSPDTAQRINEAAQLFGYTPREEAEQSHEIALVVPTLQNPFYSALAQSITEAAMVADYQIDIKVSQGDPLLSQREMCTGNTCSMAVP